MGLSETPSSKEAEVFNIRKYDGQTSFDDELKGDNYDEFDPRSDSSTTLVEGGADITESDVNAIVPTEDYDVPASTLRMWVLCVVLATVIAGVDAFFNMRFPTIHISPLVALMVAYPLGQLWYYSIPSWNIPLPFGKKLSLNPGPYNQKEHACIFIFTNVVVSAGLVNNQVVEQYKFFESPVGIGRMILVNMSCFLISFCLTGLTYNILITPANCVWPGVLSTCALLQTFHTRENKPGGGWTISRFKFFSIVFGISFVWYWFPDFILPFLSTLGAWISWCKPSSAALSQVFGVKTGLGLFPLTLDWTQVSSINNPLTTPFWSVACVFGSFVFWIWIVMPGLYYQNHWQTGHFPIMTASIYDVKGDPYQAKKVVDSNWKLDYNKFKEYSPVMLPIAFLMNLALGLAAFSAMMVNFFMRIKPDIIDPLRNKRTDVHNVALSKYKNWHWSLYAFVGLIGLGLGFAFSGAWTDTQIRPGGFIVSIVIAVCLFVPLCFIESRSNIEVSLASFFEIVSAFWFKGEPMTLLYFYIFGFSVIQHAMHISMSAKVGHYNKVSPKVAMTLLFFAAAWGAVVNPAVDIYILNHIENVCSSNAANNLVCRKQKTQFNSQLVWGLFGSHIFASGGRYSWVLWFFLVGAVVSFIITIIQWRKPNTFWQKINPTLLFGGAAQIPSVTGFNFSTWALVAFIMNFWVHRRRNAWWRKYNLVLAVGLDCGVAISVILIYFCIFYTGASAKYTWWGTEVGSEGCDGTGCPHLTGPVTRPSEW